MGKCLSYLKVWQSTSSPTSNPLFFCSGTGEGGGDAERDEQAAGDVALRAHPAWVGTETVRDRAGEDGPERVTGSSHASEENAERENLRGDMAARGIDELRKECEKEESRFGIKNVDDDAFREDASERCARRAGRSIEGFVAAEFLDAEIDEVGRAEIFDDGERCSGRDEESREADGGCGSVNERADADA